MLLVDADPQGDLTTSLGWTDQDNLSVTLSTQMERTVKALATGNPYIKEKMDLDIHISKL